MGVQQNETLKPTSNGTDSKKKSKRSNIKSKDSSEEPPKKPTIKSRCKSPKKKPANKPKPISDSSKKKRSGAARGTIEVIEKVEEVAIVAEDRKTGVEEEEEKRTSVVKNKR